MTNTDTRGRRHERALAAHVDRRERRRCVARHRGRDDAGAVQDRGGCDDASCAGAGDAAVDRGVPPGVPPPLTDEATPQAATSIAVRAGLAPDARSVSGSIRRQISDALRHRDGVRILTQTRGKSTVTYYALIEEPSADD